MHWASREAGGGVHAGKGLRSRKSQVTGENRNASYPGLGGQTLPQSNLREGTRRSRRALAR